MVVTKEQIDRINALAAKKKTIGLTAEELAEQDQLRKLYIAAFRENLKSQLDNIEIVDSNDPRLKNGKTN